METPWLSQKVIVSGFKMSALLVMSLLPLFPVSSQVTLSTHSEGRHIQRFSPSSFIPQMFSLLDTLLAAGQTAMQAVAGRITVKISALRVCAMLKRDNDNKTQDKVSVKKKHKPQ